MALGTLTLPEISEADALVVAATLGSGEYLVYVDDLSKLASYVDSTPTIRLLGPGVATSLKTLTGAVAIDSTDAVIGQVLRTTGPAAAIYDYNPGELALAASQSTGFAPAARTMYPIDISGGAFAVSMPAAASVPKDTVIGFKCSVESGGNLLTINRAGADTFDSFAAPVTAISLGATDGEVMFLRSDGVSVWYRETLQDIPPLSVGWSIEQAVRLSYTFAGGGGGTETTVLLFTGINFADIPAGACMCQIVVDLMAGSDNETASVGDTMISTIAFGADAGAETPLDRLAGTDFLFIGTPRHEATVSAVSADATGTVTITVKDADGGDGAWKGTAKCTRSEFITLP